MTKKDITFIKHIKPIIKARMKQDEGIRISRSVRLHAFTVPEDDNRKDLCKIAAKMSPRERLMNFAATGDGTYIGCGCNWDLLTTLGMNQRFGGL